MLKLDKTEYDLNTLFSFDVLKEILLKLAKSQIKLENEINDIKNKIENRDEDLGFVEQKEEEESYDNNNLIANNNINNYYGQNQEYNNENDNNDANENNNIEENTEKNENQENPEYNNININVNNKNENNILGDKKEDKKEEKKEDKNEEKKEDKNEDKKEDKIEDKKEDKNEDKKEKKPEDKIIIEKNIIPKQNNIQETQLKNNEKEQSKDIQKTKENKNIKTNVKPNVKTTQNQITSKNFKIDTNKTESQNGTFVSPDVITKIMKQLKQLQLKITEMGNSCENKIASTQKINKGNFSNVDSQISLINDKINSLIETNKDNDKKFEDLQVKVANFDVFSMFQDSGDGTIDATKVLVKSLEDKIFKKFELVDQKYKAESLETIKIKNNIENIMPKINQFTIQIEKINDTDNKFQEELNKMKKESEDNNNDIKYMLNNDINNSIEKIKNNIEENLGKKIEEIEKKINELKNNGGDNFDILKLGLRNNEINQDTIDSLDKKINDLRKKMHDLNNTVKLSISNNDTDSIKNELKDMKLILDKKITKDDLKELYNYHMNTNDEINDIKDQVSITFDDTRKLTKDINNIQQKIESINGNLALLRDNPKIGSTPMIDFGKFIDQAKLTETLRPILKELEKVYREVDSIRRDVSVMEEENKKNMKNQINKLDEEITKKLNEMKNIIQKKYLEKVEYNKNLKTLEVQIKSLGDDGKKEADSWLLAKKPLKCFNCASCEANVKNDYNSADYLPWKKYPKGEKIHRMGQGFSHMLQMMTSEFVKSIERNEFDQGLEINTKNNFGNYNNMSTQFNEKMNFNGNNNIIINNSTNKDDFIKNLKKSKMKLPKVHPYSNSKLKKYKLEEALPVSEDDINYDEVANNNNEDEIKEEKSPRILKIYKKKGGKESYETMNNPTTRNDRLSRNIEFSKKYNLLKTDKNIYDKEE